MICALIGVKIAGLSALALLLLLVAAMLVGERLRNERRQDEQAEDYRRHIREGRGASPERIEVRPSQAQNGEPGNRSKEGR